MNIQGKLYQGTQEIVSVSGDILFKSSIYRNHELSGMFANKGMYEEIDLSGFITILANNTINMFNNCVNLQTVYADCDLSNIVLSSNMFNNCSNLLFVHNLNIQIQDANSMFYNCTSLVDITNMAFSFKPTSNITNMFKNCNSLSQQSYSYLANILPSADTLTNQYISDIGLNIQKFSADEINILNSKNYIDAV